MKNKIDNSQECLDRFEQWWSLYKKKVGHKKALDRFKRLTVEEQMLCIEHTPKYVESTPNVQYRKNPLTYLNGEHFHDEIIMDTDKTVLHTNNGDDVDWDAQLRQSNG